MCRVLLEKGEHDHKLKWLIPGMEIDSTTENGVVTICTRCGHTVNGLEGKQIITLQPQVYSLAVLRDFGSKKANLYAIEYT